MGDTLTESLRDLKVQEEAEKVEPVRCLLLERLPAELRVEIYELALRLDPPVIVVDFRESPDQAPRDHATPPAYALTLTNRQIHHETSQIRYRVNAVHIFAPIFNPDPSCYPDKRAAIIERLQSIAFIQAHTQQLSSIIISLGRMVPIGRLRWIDFFGQWNAVVPVLQSLSASAAHVEVEFATVLARNREVRFRFDVKTRKNVERGLEKGMMVDGGEVEVTGVEEYRMGRIRKTIVKTLFEEGKGGE